MAPSESAAQCCLRAPEQTDHISPPLITFDREVVRMEAEDQMSCRNFSDPNSDFDCFLINFAAQVVGREEGEGTGISERL